ncbi:hypothetical protein J6590_006421 [Homalodisca vitripennis]|nr:hypothetical protein J6590_006421 [Homalodisca vitripennis]
MALAGQLIDGPDYLGWNDSSKQVLNCTLSTQPPTLYRRCLFHYRSQLAITACSVPGSSFYSGILDMYWQVGSAAYHIVVELNFFCGNTGTWQPPWIQHRSTVL